MYPCAMRIRHTKTEYVSLSCWVSARPHACLMAHRLKGLNQRELPFIRWFPFFMRKGFDLAPTETESSRRLLINRDYEPSGLTMSCVTTQNRNRTSSEKPETVDALSVEAT